jgi:hypothetical protein
MSGMTTSGTQDERQVTVPLHGNLDPTLQAHVSSPIRAAASRVSWEKALRLAADRP